MNLNGTVTVQEGDSVNITCFSSGNPVPTILWYLGDSLAPFPTSDSTRDRVVMTGEAGNTQFAFTEGNITSVLQITNATYPAHHGVYTCVGLNSHRGRDSTSNATITVQVQGMRLVSLNHISLLALRMAYKPHLTMFSQQMSPGIHLSRKPNNVYIHLTILARTTVTAIHSHACLLLWNNAY